MDFSREQKQNTENRSGKESSRLEQELKRDLIMKRDFRSMILTFLILYYVVGLEATLLPLLYVTISLLFSLDSCLGYLHATTKFTLTTSRVVPILQRVPCFEAPIYIPRPHNPSPCPPPPYVRGPRVILEAKTDESLSS